MTIVPDLQQRLAMRNPPSGLHLAVQTWEHLLFMHWQVAPEVVRPYVPDSLEIDLHGGTAWVSLVVLTVQDAAPAVGIPLPWLSFFHQANLRTYVQRDGLPGIWFFSTDSDSQLMVSAGRRFYHLPYYSASFHESRLAGAHGFEMFRRGGDPAAELSLMWRPGEPLGGTVPETPEFFLLDRYCVYAAEGDRLFRARVHHGPWSLMSATVKRYRTNLFEMAGLPAPRGEALVEYARAMPQVKVWPMEQLKITLPEGA